MPEAIRQRILNWVERMHTGDTGYRMSASSDSSLFTSLFALFVFDLFGEVGRWNPAKRNVWIDYINSFQDEGTGLFLPYPAYTDFGTKTDFQLTSFCLSALHMLNGEPKYQLNFLNTWTHQDDVNRYLTEQGCLEGRPGSGNMAMFLAIFLSYQYDKNESSAADNIAEWFYQHNKFQNRSTGFWGNGIRKQYYSGFQNAFHQFVVYNYWDQRIASYEKIVDSVIAIQDSHGHFTPTPGGGACFDYDAADVLINLGLKNNYRSNDIKKVLQKLFYAVLDNQNPDGGFCESNKIEHSKTYTLAKNFSNIFSGPKPLLWFVRLAMTMHLALKRGHKLNTHWTNTGTDRYESDLWSTWFRCLTLAEISEAIDIEHPVSKLEWHFQDFIGLGCFKKIPSTSCQSIVS